MKFAFLQIFLCLALYGCTSPHGPKASKVKKSAELEVIYVTSAEDIPAPTNTHFFSGTPHLNADRSYREELATRDVISVSVTDTDSNSPFFRQGSPYEVGPFEIPSSGQVKIPYVGEVKVGGMSIASLNRSLSSKFSRVSSTADATVLRQERFDFEASVIGEVNRPGSYPIDRVDFDSLDLLAAAGGGRSHPDSYIYKLKRDGKSYVFNYDTISDSPFDIQDGDVVSVEQDPSYSYYTLGQFRSPGRQYLMGPNTSLADAISDSGGFSASAHAKGVFVFRDMAYNREWCALGKACLPGQFYQVYVIDVKDAKYPFIVQNFRLNERDLVYVSQSPLSEVTKMTSQLTSIASTGARAQAIGR